MSPRSVAFLAAMLSMAPLGLLAAQQAAAPTGTPPTAAATAAPTASPAPAAVTSAPLVPQPQYSPLFQKGDSASVLGAPDKSAAASGGSNHTIVVSTLVLVLAVVILVLLIF
jgi:hypothetical protein